MNRCHTSPPHPPAGAVPATRAACGEPESHAALEAMPMNAKTMSVPIPPALDHARLADANFTIRGRSPKGPVLAHFDPVGQAGGICYLIGEVWAIYGPMPFGEFVASLGTRGIQVDDTDDLARWVTACTAMPADVRPN